MSDGKMHIARKAFGLVLFGFGLAWLVAETRGVVARDVAHPVHLVVSGLLMFSGGYLLNPPDAEGIADAIVKRLPVIRSIWPGGSRRDDPPPEPCVPPPPRGEGQ